MTTTKKSVIVAASMLMVGVGFADTLTWTGEGLDHLWSTKENWDKGRVPANGDSVTLKAFDDEAITNDIAGLSLVTLSAVEAEEPHQLTLVGEPITLTTTGYAVSFETTLPMTNWVELTVESGQYARFMNAHMMAPFHLLGPNFEAYDRSDARNKGVYFHGHVDGSGMTMKSPTCNLHFLGTYDLAAVVGTDANSTTVYFEGPGDNCPLVKTTTYTSYYANRPNAFPTNAVIEWGSLGSVSVQFFGAQTIDRLVRADSGANVPQGVLNETTGTVPTLTMRGTDNAFASVKITGSMRLTWDPVGNFTQTIADQAHTLSGGLVVNGGTLESAGNNTFANATSLKIAAGATFKVSASARNAAVNPFPGAAAKVNAEIAGNGVIEVPSGVTVQLKTLLYRGIPIPPGKYDAGPDVPWISGEGSVSVASAVGTGWKAAVNGNWSDAENWTDGVPTLDKPAYLTLEGDTPYVVSLDADAVLPNTLKLSGAGTTLKVPAGVDKIYDGTSKVADYSIKDGATLKVDGGTFVVTNFNGTFVISGTGVATGRVAIAGGLFRYSPRLDPNWAKIRRLELNAGGAVEVTGGVLSVVRATSDDTNMNYPILWQKGGTLSVTGTGRYDQSSTYDAWTTFGSGFSTLADNAVITNRKYGLDVRPAAAGETAELVVKDRANFTGGTAHQRVGGLAGGFARVIFDADVDWGTSARTVYSGSTACLYIGYGDGTSYFEQRQGFIAPGPMGVTIGGSPEYKRTTEGCEATYVMKGGMLEVWGQSGDGWGQLYGPMGLAVGCGYFTSTTEGRAYHGVLRIEGGTVDSYQGYTTVGGGYGRGEVIQMGGTFQAQRTYMAIGYGHGVGRYVISNGTATVSCPLYIGGADLSLCSYNSQFTVARCPWINLHDAEGTLSVAGGTFTAATKDTTLGVDGAGTIEMDGSKGQLTLKNVIFTHRDDNAASGGTLRFKLDADGVSPIKAMSVAFDEKAKIEVDLGGYEGRSLKLVESASVTGFDPDMVTITGARAKDAAVKVTPAGLRLSLAQGMMILLR